MARIRTIKPEFFTSEQVAECSTNARLLFVGLWCFCDDKGRHPDSPRQIKMEVFPGDDLSVVDIEEMLDELHRNGLIERYVVDGKGFFYVTGWHHQRIDKAQKPKHPAPEDGEIRHFQERSWNDRGTLPPDTTLSDTILPDTKGRESGSPGAIPDGSASPPPTPEDGKAKRASRLPADWLIPPAWIEETKTKYPGMPEAFIRRHAERFRNHWASTGGQRGLKTDWKLTWWNWIDKEADSAMRQAKHPDDLGGRSMFTKPVLPGGGTVGKKTVLDDEEVYG